MTNSDRPPVHELAKDLIKKDAATARPGKAQPGTTMLPPGARPVSRPLLGGAIATGLVTVALVGLGSTVGAVAPAPSAPPSVVPVATPSAVAGTAVLTSPAPGSPVFVSFDNSLTSLTISGFGAPPPGSHGDHNSVFSVRATGDGLIALWRLENPTCGALRGAEAHGGTVVWPHSSCPSVEAAARITVTVLWKADLAADGTPQAGAPYFVYSQTARAGDAPETSGLAKNASLQYFGPAPTAPPTTRTAASPGSGPGRAPAPWVPAVAIIGAACCAALAWRSGVLESVARLGSG